MKISVLGMGCPTCKRLFEDTKLAVAELKIKANVEYIVDIEKIMKMGITKSPVLLVDGKAVIVGYAPNKEKIKAIIQGE